MSKKNIQIIKGNGDHAPFSPQKVLNSIKRVGVPEKEAKRILKQVEKQLKNNMTTEEIYSIVRKELINHEPWAAARYNLRDAILKMGPAGYNFEKYVASVLQAYGYKTELPEVLQGACIKHEVDVVAEKDGRRIFIEAKFRRDYGGAVNIKDTMATWSRFLDLVDGSKINLCPHFDEVWIVTNARFTDQSLKFGHCKNMKLVGWNHPKERSFAGMVDVNALYPITILDDVTKPELKSFAEANLMLCRELTQKSLDELHQLTKIDTHRLEQITKTCKPIMTGVEA